MRARALLLPIAGICVLAGCGGGAPGAPATADVSTEQATSSTPSATESTGVANTREAAVAAATEEPAIDGITAVAAESEVYFTAGEQFRSVKRDLSGAADPVEAATEALVDGPTKAERRNEVRSAIPEGVELRGVEVSDDGTAVVEVSREFLDGVPRNPRRRNEDESSTLNARLAQVAFTTTQFEGVDEAKVIAAGAPVEAPSGRRDYRQPRSAPLPVRKARGDRVPGTRAIQRKLARMRYLPSRAVDGRDGYWTREAVIAFQSWNDLTRDGIVGPQTIAALRSGSAPEPADRGPKRRIEVYRDRGVALLIRGGKVRRAIHVSSGAPGYTTPSGRFRVFRKEERSWSYPYSVWLPWASYFNNGIAFHEWLDVPPYPASHGCVRVPTPEAKGLYRFAGFGTHVLVY